MQRSQRGEMELQNNEEAVISNVSTWFSPYVMNLLHQNVSEIVGHPSERDRDVTKTKGSRVAGISLSRENDLVLGLPMGEVMCLRSFVVARNSHVRVSRFRPVFS
jgi:hypothetical protein